MNVALLQIDLRWQQPLANRLHIENLIGSVTDTDLVILPEMFTTGFGAFDKMVTEGPNSESFKWMLSTAQAKNVALCGSLLVNEDNKCYNRLYFVRPDGTYSVYNKRHLFSYSGENKYFEQGIERVVVEYRGFRILLQICYDLRFPVFTRNKEDYDMIIYVANWPMSRVNAWDVLLRARAIENQCYVIGVNRVGSDPMGTLYNGRTVLLDYMGKEIAMSKTDKEEIVSGEMNMQKLFDFRKKFPALSDADSFEIIY